MVPVAGSASDAEAAADPVIARRHAGIVERLTDLLEIAGSRLDNQRAWRLLPRRAQRALEAAQGPTSDLPSRLSDLYDNTVSLGSFVAQDDAFGADSSAMDSPLDPAIRRALVDYLALAAPWLRNFPSVLQWDSARQDFLARPELFEPARASLDAAREFFSIAAAVHALSREDAERGALPLETATRPGVLAEKAGYRGVANARRLLTQSSALVAGFLAGAVAPGVATPSDLEKHLAALLAKGEQQALELAQGFADDLKAAVANVVVQNRKRRVEGGGAAPAILGTRDAGPAWPPRTALAVWRDSAPGLPAEVFAEMVTLPAGRFIMGAPEAEEDSRPNERPQREVSVPSFGLGRFAVTFAQWDAARASGAELPEAADEGWGRGDLPVINVSWQDAQAYCAWLNRRLGLVRLYRLPTEAEWEYACRAGTTTAFSFGPTISPAQANYHGKRTVAVGSLPGNAWGLHEMHGNVWEWVEDVYRGSYADAPTDGSQAVRDDAAAPRVLRGGSWDSGPGDWRSAFRSWSNPDLRDVDVGFRLARTL